MDLSSNTLVKADETSLAIVSLLKDCFREATTIVGSEGNVYTIFFHDLMIHFSGILIHRTAYESYTDLIQFPRVNKSYALSPWSVCRDNLFLPMPARTLKTCLRELSLSGLALGEALPFSKRQDRLISRVVNLLGSFKPFVCAYLPRQSEQIDWLLDTIGEICRLHDISGKNVIQENWRLYAEYHSTDSQISIRDRGLVLGTRNNLQNRKLAVNYLQQDKEVVAITHGEVANSVMDEPPFGYSERTLCTTLIDYGDFDRDGDYNSPLITPTRTFCRNASTVARYYRRNDRIRRPDRSRCRALYIPTTYSGNDLYGPFHIFEDAIYRQWHSALFGVLSGLTMKVHPKSKSGPLSGVKIEQRQLEDCIPDYDLLIFDYFATGAMQALMSNKPVMYFDIGLRRLAPEFARDLKNRCGYAKIDLSADMKKQSADAIARFFSTEWEFSNADVARYSLCEESDFHWTALLKAVSRGSPPSW